MMEDFINLYKEVPGVAGHIDVKIKEIDGRFKVRVSITQSPRFFEISLRNRRVDEVPIVTARICGVCSMAHLLGSLIALEKALGVDMGEAVARLRRIVEAIGIIQNNLVHVLIALPDYLGYRNLVELARAEPSLIKKFLKLNTEVLRAYRGVAGRFTHTHSINVAYQGKLVTRYDLIKSSEILKSVHKEVRGLLSELAGKWRDIKFEDPARNFLTVGTQEYPVIGDDIATSDGEVVNVMMYRELINEEEVDYSNSKHSTYRGKPFFVGSRARLLRKYDEVSKEVGELINLLRLDLNNPFDNVKAQLIEVAYLTLLAEHELSDLAGMVGSGIKLYDLSKLRGSGEAVSAVEAPRGLLIHHYSVRDGKLVTANIITPTAMNSKHIEVSCEVLVNKLRDQGISRMDDLREYAAVLVRSYDPCLPCAVH